MTTNEAIEQTSDQTSLATILVVTSGKGGVGKTAISVNVSSELAARGWRVMLVDADLGLANAHILMGLKPGHTLTDYLEEKVELADIVSDGPGGLKLISGGQGVQKMANLGDIERRRILDAIYDLRPFCDLIVIDTGAGVSKSVTDFVEIADHTVVVTNANFAAIANAYGIIKVMVQEGQRNPTHLIVNRARSPEEADQVYKKLRGCTEKFLEFTIDWLGLVPEDARVNQAVQKRTPFTQMFPETVASIYVRKIVENVESLIGTKVGEGSK